MERITIEFDCPSWAYLPITFAIADIGHCYNFIANLWRNTPLTMVLYCLVPALIKALFVYGPQGIYRLVTDQRRK